MPNLFINLLFQCFLFSIVFYSPLFCAHFIHYHRYSTGFTSVHGERPSAEYAKLRKESLESEFGHALGTYRSKSFSVVYHFGPFLALYRAAIISFHVLKLTIWQFFVQDVKKRAIKVLTIFKLFTCFAVALLVVLHCLFDIEKSQKEKSASAIYIANL